MTVQQSGRTGVAIDNKIKELEDLKNAFKLKTSNDIEWSGFDSFLPCPFRLEEVKCEFTAK